MSRSPIATLAAYSRHIVAPIERPKSPPLETDSAAVPGLRLALHDELAAIEPAWRELEPNASCTVFQNFDYLAAWQRHIGPHENATPAIVSIHGADGVLAILPLAVTGRSLRKLTWLGQDLCDYPGPLLARGFAGSVPTPRFNALWEEIVALIRRNPRLRHALIDLRKMSVAIGTQANPFVDLPLSLHASEAYVATLLPHWNEFYERRRSAKARRHDRSKLKRLAELGAVDLVSPESADQAAHLLTALLAQKSETFARKGIADVFRRRGYRAFFLDLVSNARTREFTHVSELRVGPSAAAIGFGLEYRGRYFLYLVSYDESFSRFSPGAIHLNALLRRSIERGLHEFDFLVGLQRLKREWSDQRIQLYDHVAGTTFVGYAIAASLRGWSRLKRAIKASPVLWDGYLALRALVGTLKPRSGTSRSPLR
jgi:CelD/BcsL family acetyltransferase involved in cellulose biosynthesis